MNTAYGDEYDDEELLRAAGIQSRTAALRRQPMLTATPSSGVETPPPQPGASPMNPAMRGDDYRAKALGLLGEAAQAKPEESDLTQLREYARGRDEKSNRDFALGLTLSALGGESLAPSGQHVLRQALASQEPMKFAGGVIERGQYTADPTAAAAQRAARLEAQAKLYESMASHADTITQRDAAAKAADQTRREIAALVASNRQEPLVQVYDPETQTSSYVPRSQAAGRQAPPKANAGGRPLTATEVDKITGDEAKVAQFASLIGSWQPGFGGLGTSVGNTIGRYSPLSTEGQREQALWWQNYQNFVNDVRHGQFGAALTPTEKAEFEKAIITPNTDARQVAAFLDKQHKLFQLARERRVGNLGRAGYDVSGFGGETRRPGAPAPTTTPTRNWNELDRPR